MVDGVADSLGPVRCKGATTRELAEAALTRVYAERSAQLAQRLSVRAGLARGRCDLTAVTPGKFSYCVVTGNDAVASPLDPDRLLMPVHKCCAPPEIDFCSTPRREAELGLYSQDARLTHGSRALVWKCAGFRISGGGGVK